MYKLAIIGLLIAALAAPAASAGQRARARVRALCPQSAIFLPGRDYAICGGQFWVRDSQTGKLEQVRFWRLQHLGEGPDRP